jgi:hypothetical protein
MHPIPTLQRISQARSSIATELRELAAALEAAPIVQLGEALTLINPALEELRRWVDRAGLRR